MTLKQLSQLYYLNREIELDVKRLKRLQSKVASPSGSKLSDMRGAGCYNSLESVCAEIIDLESIIQAKLTQCVHEQNRLERYIAEIPDSLTRQIFTLRFIDGLNWMQVATSIGNNTPDSVRMTCYRYISKK